MCVIIDVNKISKVVTLSEDGVPIIEWLNRGGTLVYCADGVFEHEYPREALKFFGDLWRNSQAIQIEFQAVRVKMANLPDNLRSDRSDGRNDRHILALALASGAEVLYTGDRALMDDFRDRAVMGGLRGRIYSGKRNKALLRQDLCEDC